MGDDCDRGRYPDKAACKKDAPTAEIEDTTDEKAAVKPAARPRGRKPKAE